MIATGAFGVPQVPSLAHTLWPDIHQLHSEDYRRPADLPDGPVLVVGGGNSGRQIAAELSLSGREVHLALGGATLELPDRFMGRDIFWWLDHTGLLRTPANSLIGRRSRGRNDIVIGTGRRALRRAGVTLHPRAATTDGPTIDFEDASTIAPAAVVWATGYRHDDRWIDIETAITNDRLVTTAGHTPFPGLYTLGRPWQSTRGSSLLGGVGSEAQHLADHLLRSG